MRKHPNWVKHKGDRKSENYKARKYIRENPLAKKKTSKFDRKKKVEEEKKEEPEKQAELEDEEEEEEEQEQTKSVLSEDDDDNEEDDENGSVESGEGDDDDDEKVDIKSLPKRVQQKIRYQERKNKRLTTERKPKKGKVFMDVNNKKINL